MSDEPKSITELAGLLVTKPEAPNKSANGSGKETLAAGEQLEDGEYDDLPAGDETQTEDDALWTSESEAEDALLGGEQPEAGAEGADEDASEEDGPEGTANDPLYTVTIDGKQENVTLSEALAGYQRNADYTKKTTELAERRKAVDAEVTAVQTARTAYDDMLRGLQGQLDGALNQRKPADWDALRASDPVAFAAEWADHQRKQDAKATIVAERDRVAKEAMAENNKKLSDFVNGERVKLFEKVPEWRDDAKRNLAVKAIFDGAEVNYSFTKQELSQVYDHRMVLLARDAMRYRALVARQAKGKAKLNTAPVVAPRGRQPQQSSAAKARVEQTKRFQKTGKIDDAVSLILAR